MRVWRYPSASNLTPRPLKFCAVCQLLMDRKKAETWKRYGLRKCCSVKCANELRGAAPPSDCPCEICGGRIPPKWEVPGHFNRKRYCSRVCENKARYIPVVQKARRDRAPSMKPQDRGREAVLYGGRVTDAYRVGFIRRVVPLGDHHASAGNQCV